MRYLAERLEALEQLWLEIGNSFAGISFLESRGLEGRPALLAKLASVALLGVWACVELWRHRLETTSCPQDIQAEGIMWTSPTPGSPQEHGSSVYCDYVTRQLVQSLASTRPVHQHCLEQERLMVARMLILLQSWRQPQYWRSI